MNEWMNEWLGHPLTKSKETHFAWMSEALEALMIPEPVILCPFPPSSCPRHGLLLLCWHWTRHTHISRWHATWITWSPLDSPVLTRGSDPGIAGFGQEVLSRGHLRRWTSSPRFLDRWSCWARIQLDLANGFGFALAGGSVLGAMLVNSELETVGLVESWRTGGGGVE